MKVCDYCGEEIPAGTYGLTVRAVIDNLPADRQVNLQGDLHPECLDPWYDGAKSVKGDRPAVTE